MIIRTSIKNSIQKSYHFPCLQLISPFGGVVTTQAIFHETQTKLSCYYSGRLSKYCLIDIYVFCLTQVLLQGIIYLGLCRINLSPIVFQYHIQVKKN